MPRALILLMSRSWMGIARLPRALAMAGWDVASLCQENSFLAKTRFVDKRYSYPEKIQDLYLSLQRAVEEFRPDIIIPGCERTVDYLQKLTQVRLTGGGPKAEQTFHRMQALVRRSISHPDGFSITLSKTHLQSTAQQMGLRVPQSRSARSIEEACALADGMGYPVVVKGEFGFAGSAVRICATPSELVSAWKAVTQKSIANAVDVQSYIKGIPAMCSGVAYNGVLLECAFALKLKTHPFETSPCSLAQFAANAEAQRVLAAIVERISFNGFCSCDFILCPDSGDCYLLEFNPRPVPLSALGHLNGRDMAVALAKAMGSVPPSLNCDNTGSHQKGAVAFFPNEWQRDPGGFGTGSDTYWDVPWDDPELLRAYVDSVAIPRLSSHGCT